MRQSRDCRGDDDAISSKVAKHLEPTHAIENHLSLTFEASARCEYGGLCGKLQSARESPGLRRHEGGGRKRDGHAVPSAGARGSLNVRNNDARGGVGCR